MGCTGYVGREVMFCFAMWLCDVVNWRMIVKYIVPMSQYYDSILQSTTLYCKVLPSAATSIIGTTAYYKLQGTKKFYSVLQRITPYHSYHKVPIRVTNSILC